LQKTSLYCINVDTRRFKTREPIINIANTDYLLIYCGELMEEKVQATDYDSTLRIYKLDLRHKVRGIWDENIPLINHTVIEARGLSDKFLNSGTELKKACDAFCDDVELSVVERRVHNFEPIGKTVFYVLEESHLSIHTWPESGYLHFDLVTCTKDEKSQLQVASIFEKHFQPTHMRLIKMMY